MLQVTTPDPPKWHKVPQVVYSQGKRRWDYKPLEPILFQVEGFPGVNMGDALRNKFTGLVGRDDLMLTDERLAVSCRLSVR